MVVIVYSTSLFVEQIALVVEQSPPIKMVEDSFAVFIDNGAMIVFVEELGGVSRFQDFAALEIIGRHLIAFTVYSVEEPPVDISVRFGVTPLFRINHDGFWLNARLAHVSSPYPIRVAEGVIAGSA